MWVTLSAWCSKLTYTFVPSTAKNLCRFIYRESSKSTRKSLKKLLPKSTVYRISHGYGHTVVQAALVWMIELLLLFICHPFPDSIRSEPRQVRSARWHPQSMIDLLLEIAMETAKSTHRRMIADLNMSLGQAIPAPRLLHRLLSAKKIWIKKTVDRATMTTQVTTSGGINRKIGHTAGLIIQGLQCHLWKMQQIMCT